MPSRNRPRDDDQNVALATTSHDVDRANAEFYGRYPFPWRALRLDRVLDADIERILLCQSLGDWHHEAIPRRPTIWVAGCGTNQAAVTALLLRHRFELADERTDRI